MYRDVMTVELKTITIPDGEANVSVKICVCEDRSIKYAMGTVIVTPKDKRKKAYALSMEEWEITRGMAEEEKKKIIKEFWEKHLGVGRREELFREAWFTLEPGT